MVLYNDLYKLQFINPYSYQQSWINDINNHKSIEIPQNRRLFLAIFVNNTDTVRTSVPTIYPTSESSKNPTNEPTNRPLMNNNPTSQPTGSPTIDPTGQPSSQPSSNPSSQPTMTPTMLIDNVYSQSKSSQYSNENTQMCIRNLVVKVNLILITFVFKQ